MQDRATDQFGQNPKNIRRKKVVIVDDSRSIRGWLRVLLEQDPRLDVVGEAEDAITAREVIKQTNPDVITLDIEMPGMSGLEFLEKLMRLRPLPVVMISGATKSNSEATITALTLGAIDCILKPSSTLDRHVSRDIIQRVFAAACSTVQMTHRAPPTSVVPTRQPHPHKMPLILIGASTGGVAALERVLADLHADGPPVVIVQHMPGPFLISFTQHLDRSLPQDVAIACEEEPLGPGMIRLAPADGEHTIVARKGASWVCRYEPQEDDVLHCPSVDMLFQSAHDFGKNVIAVILTGLGRDGASAMLSLRKMGARTLGQDAASSVIYGMPRVAQEIGAVAEQHPLNKIGDAVNRAVLQHASDHINRTR